MKIQFIWCWKMWEILLNTIIKSWFCPNDIFISLKTNDKNKYLIDIYSINIWIKNNCDIIILAVKPQNFDELYFTNFSKNSLIISIMAWVSVDSIYKKTWNINIIRCMPNTPLSIWRWVIWYYKNENLINDNRVEFFINTFKKIWSIIEIHNEDKINKITALSWSWPAYFYYITEILIEKAIEFWFSEKEASIIVNNTFIWSAYLLEESEISLSKLKESVTSKWWTTQKALDIFSDKWLSKIIKLWIDGAYNRAIEMSK